MNVQFSTAAREVARGRAAAELSPGGSRDGPAVRGHGSSQTKWGKARRLGRKRELPGVGEKARWTRAGTVILRIRKD